MGRLDKELPFYDNAGGLNETVSAAQMEQNEAIRANNVIITKYGRYGRIRKRCGRQVLNATPFDGKVVGIYPYTLNGTKYIGVFTNNGTYYNVNTSTYIGTQILTGKSVGKVPTIGVLSDKMYINFDPTIITINDAESLTGWVASPYGNDPVLSTGTKYKGNSSVKTYSGNAYSTTALTTIDGFNDLAKWTPTGASESLVAGYDGTASHAYAMTVTPVSATWTDRVATSGTRIWNQICSSSDGIKLAAVVIGGYIYTSTDSGATWTERTTSGSRQWSYIACSSDGTLLYATERVAGTGYIYKSVDSGNTWTTLTNAGQHQWYRIACSSDGTKIIAGTYSNDDGYLYTSTDSGTTWVKQTGAGTSNGFKHTLHCSADGLKIVTAEQGAYIYTSIDGGYTWTQRTSAGARAWSSGCISNDGTKIFALTTSITYGYSSIDGGTTWVERTIVAGTFFIRVAMSQNGEVLAVSSPSTNTRISGDFGVTWTSEVNSPATNTLAITMSSSGNKIALCRAIGSTPGSIWTGVSTTNISAVSSAFTTSILTYRNIYFWYKGNAPSIYMRIGTDATNYWTYTVTTDVDGKAFNDGVWHKICIRLSADNAVVTLTPTWSTTTICTFGVLNLNGYIAAVHTFDTLEHGPGSFGLDYVPTTSVNLTGKTIDVAVGANTGYVSTSRSRTNDIATITVTQHLLAKGDYIRVKSAGTTSYDTGNQFVPITDVNAGLTTISYASKGFAESTTADTTIYIETLKGLYIQGVELFLYTDISNFSYWIYRTDSSGNKIGSVMSKISLDVGVSAADGYSGTGVTTTSVTRIGVRLWTSQGIVSYIYMDDIRYSITESGIYYTTNGTTFTKVTNPYVPKVNYITVWDNCLFGVDNGYIYGSNINDGTDWYPASTTLDRDGDGIVDSGKSAFSSPVGYGDGDTITGLRALNDELIITKRFGIYRMEPLGNPKYRIKAQLSGTVGEGVGAFSHQAIQNAVVENLYSDVYGKAEYLVFHSPFGIHALGATGNPLDLHQRVQETYRTYESDKLAKSFMFTDPANKLLILALTDTNGVSQKQLVYSLSAKAWTTYTIPDLTAAAVDTGTIPYNLLGDANGMLYAFDSSDTGTYFKDDTSTAPVAIDGIFESRITDYQNLLNLLSVRVSVKAFSFTNPHTVIGVIGDNNVTTSELLESGQKIITRSTGIDIYSLPIRTQSQTLSFYIQNATIDESFDLIGYVLEVENTKDRKGN